MEFWARSSTAEQGTHNPLVAGSNPAGPTYNSCSIATCDEWLEITFADGLLVHKISQELYGPIKTALVTVDAEPTPSRFRLPTTSYSAGRQTSIAVLTR